MQSGPNLQPKKFSSLKSFFFLSPVAHRGVAASTGYSRLPELAKKHFIDIGTALLKVSNHDADLQELKGAWVKLRKKLQSVDT